MAASVVMTVPIAFIFFYFQKLFVWGLDGRRDQGMTNSQTIDHSACNLGTYSAGCRDSR